MVFRSKLLHEIPLSEGKQGQSRMQMGGSKSIVWLVVEAFTSHRWRNEK